MKEVKKIKCQKCGFENILGTKQCVKCKKKLEQLTWSCPKCAKKNLIEFTSCVTCGYRYNKQKRTKKNIIFNLFFSLLLVILLLVLLFLNKKGVVYHIHFGFKLFSCFLILCIVYSTFSYGKKDIVRYREQEKKVKEEGRIKRLKWISNVVVILGSIFIFGLLWYFLF